MFDDIIYLIKWFSLRLSFSFLGSIKDSLMQLRDNRRKVSITNNIGNFSKKLLRKEREFMKIALINNVTCCKMI